MGPFGDVSHVINLSFFNSSEVLIRNLNVYYLLLLVIYRVGKKILPVHDIGIQSVSQKDCVVTDLYCYFH